MNNESFVGQESPSDKMKKEIKKITDMDFNKDNHIEKKEIRKMLENKFKKEYANKKLPENVTQEQINKYLDQNTDQLWGLYTYEPKFKGKTKIKVKDIISDIEKTYKLAEKNKARREERKRKSDARRKRLLAERRRKKMSKKSSEKKPKKLLRKIPKKILRKIQSASDNILKPDSKASSVSVNKQEDIPVISQKPANTTGQKPATNSQSPGSIASQPPDIQEEKRINRQTTSTTDNTQTTKDQTNISGNNVTQSNEGEQTITVTIKTAGGNCLRKPFETDPQIKREALRKTAENLGELAKIGKNMCSDNKVNKNDNKKNDNESEIGKDRKSEKGQNNGTQNSGKQNNRTQNNRTGKGSTVNKQLEHRPTDSNDRHFANVNNRDSKLLEANDGVRPIDPSNFSFKPDVRFAHKQPSRKIASAYGWSFMPPHYWSVPQQRPPACIPNKQNTATVTPIYDKSVPVDVMDYTQVGSILPKFEYNEVHNPNYYYPGWIAKEKEPYPGKNGRKVMKTGEYYSMKLARPTGLEPKDAINFGNKIIDEKIHPQRVIRNSLDRSIEVRSRKVISNKKCTVLNGNPAFDKLCQSAAIKSNKCKSGCSTKIKGLGNICCKTDCCK
tara:strand:+ start:675 stop:2516 length:1842 start_codon:yes stop_codon:yes gene_type:complete